MRLDNSDTPEFDSWRWVDYWQPLEEVIFFKRRVYRQALSELAPLIFPEGVPVPARLMFTHLPRPRAFLRHHHSVD